MLDPGTASDHLEPRHNPQPRITELPPSQSGNTDPAWIDSFNSARNRLAPSISVWSWRSPIQPRTTEFLSSLESSNSLHLSPLPPSLHHPSLELPSFLHLILTIAGTGLLAILAGAGGGGGGWYDLPRVSSLIVLELRDKNQRVGRDERNPKIPEFKRFGHLVTSQVKK